MAAFSLSRRRNPLVLAAIALVVVGLAGLALTQRAAQMGLAFAPQPVVPGLADTINTIGEVMVETRDGGSFHARRTEDGNWVIPERNNFPANIQMVRAASVGMSELMALEPRTAQPELLGRLGLGAPEDGGDAVRVRLNNREGETIGDLLIGNAQGVADPEGLARLYVRRNGDNQSYLARGSMVVSPDLTDWLDRTLFTVDVARIRSAALAPFDGPLFTLARETEMDTDFVLSEIPPGREMSYPGVAYVPATALANFTFLDVMPAGDIDLTETASIVTNTFDGLSVIVRVVRVGDAHWALLAAEPLPEAADDVVAEALGINQMAQGWAFLLPEFTAQTFLTTRDSLLAPEGETAAP
jgi:hypothetical protein